MTDKWQPIETAPKDGTAVLAFWLNEYTPTSKHYGIAMFDRGEWCSVDFDDSYADPTHWMPLPAPPDATPAPEELK